MGLKKFDDVKFLINKLVREGIVKNLRVDEPTQTFYFTNHLGVNYKIKPITDKFAIYYEQGGAGRYLVSSYFSSLTDLRTKLSRKPLAEDIMINELYSKRPANLDEIMDGSDDPSKDEILNSKDFQVNLVNDLVNNKKNVDSWSVRDASGSIADLDRDEDQFNIDYEFQFVYNFHGIKVPLTLFINGYVDVNWKGSYVLASHNSPAEGPNASIDYKSLGRGLDLGLFDDDGSEISITWLTPDLQTKVVKSIISPYL